MSWIGSIMGEYIVSRAGLGYLIVYGGQVCQTRPRVMAATVILCFLAALMYFLVALLEKKARPHMSALCGGNVPAAFFFVGSRTSCV